MGLDAISADATKLGNQQIPTGSRRSTGATSTLRCLRPSFHEGSFFHSATLMLRTLYQLLQATRYVVMFTVCEKLWFLFMFCDNVATVRQGRT